MATLDARLLSSPWTALHRNTPSPSLLSRAIFRSRRNFRNYFKTNIQKSDKNPAKIYNKVIPEKKFKKIKTIAHV